MDSYARWVVDKIKEAFESYFSDKQELLVLGHEEVQIVVPCIIIEWDGSVAYEGAIGDVFHEINIAYLPKTPERDLSGLLNEWDKLGGTTISRIMRLIEDDIAYWEWDGTTEVEAVAFNDYEGIALIWNLSICINEYQLKLP